MDLKERRLLLSRANLGRRLMPALTAKLSTILGRPVEGTDFLPLERSDAVWAGATSLFTADQSASPTFEYGWPEEELEVMDRELKALGGQLGRALLYFGVSDRVGALPVEASEVLGRAAALVALDGDAIYLTTEDGTNALWLEYAVDWERDGLSHPYSLVVRGEHWAREAASVLLAA